MAVPASPKARWEEREEETPPRHSPPSCSGSEPLLRASYWILSSELSCVCTSSRWGAGVVGSERSWCCAVSHHALPFSITVAGGGGDLCRWPAAPRFNFFEGKCPSPAPHLCIFSSARWAYTCCFSYSAAEAASVCSTGQQQKPGVLVYPKVRYPCLWAGESWAVCCKIVCTNLLFDSKKPRRSTWIWRVELVALKIMKIVKWGLAHTWV